MSRQDPSPPSTPADRRRTAMLVSATALCLGNGVFNLLSVLGGPALPAHAVQLAKVFPVEFVHVSRFAAMLAGLGLVLLSINVWRRKRRAYHAGLALAFASIAAHLTKGLDYEEAMVSAILIAVLWLSRHLFTVGATTPDVGLGLKRLALAAGSAIGYGIVGFWLLERPEFGIDFSLVDAAHHTLRFLAFVGDESLIPLTHYAAWFLNSLSLLSVTAIAYSAIAVAHPVIYRYRTLPHERELAKAIVRKHGKSSLDFFKHAPDKSLFFSPSRSSFLAYRVGAQCAIVLGNPVGPEGEISFLIRDFEAMCRDNDWDVAFYQVPAESIPLYERLGFHKLKVGEDAIMDLTAFSLESRAGSTIRGKFSQFARAGIVFAGFEPPLPPQLLAQARDVSSSWLGLPGRTEHTFSLGQFDSDYVRQTPIYAAMDAGGRMLAFVNVIPSYYPGETTIDLMRHNENAPSGVMDFLFAHTMLALQARGFTRFNMGMAPMGGFHPEDAPGVEERAIHYLMQRLTSISSYRGLRAYKAKFATSWEPRYLVYRDLARLPRLGEALAEVTELGDSRP